MDVAATANYVYKKHPETFKMMYATSKQGFVKDRLRLREFPESSFEAFRTQENPAICRNQFSEKYANIYSDPYPMGVLSQGFDLARMSCPGDFKVHKLYQETQWIQIQINLKKGLRSVYSSDLKAVAVARMGAARE